MHAAMTLCMYFYLCACVCVSMCASWYLCVCLRVCPSVCVSVCLSTCRFVYYFLCLCLCMCPMYLCTYVCRSELCVYAAVSISVCLSSYLCKCVRGSFHCGRLEIIWKCSPSPLGTFHYLSRLSPFHTSTSNIARIIIKILVLKQIAHLLIS